MLTGRSRMTNTRCSAQDFFEPQAIKEPAAFVLRFVLHDWPDAPNIKLLKNLRAAAKPTTRLVIFEALMPHVCAVPGGPPPPPSPLLGNVGAGGAFLTMLDLQVRYIHLCQLITRVTRVRADVHDSWREGAHTRGVRVPRCCRRLEARDSEAKHAERVRVRSRVDIWLCGS